MSTARERLTSAPPFPERTQLNGSTTPASNQDGISHLSKANMFRALTNPPRRLRVSDAARRTKLTARAIRFYEARGLIGSNRDGTGQRLYDEPSIARLEYIARCRRLGFGLTTIFALLEIGDAAGPEAQTRRMLECCAGRLAELESQRAEIEMAMATLVDERETGSAVQLRATA